MEGTTLGLTDTWTIGTRIGGGGFGQVYRAVDSRGAEGAVKFVPKAPGAERELLFVDLEGIRNVVPIIDSGETDSHYVLVMPLAEGSLAERIESTDLGAEEINEILLDIATALEDLDENGVVHRDLKPANVLSLEGHWCLADFGISRYAEATTAPDTQKFAMSPPYAAPERWRAERAGPAADIYAFGVMAHELINGARPFPGPDVYDFREQHLHEDPPELQASPAMAALVAECLYKAAGTRPAAANVRARLEGAAMRPTNPGLALLQEANRAQVLQEAAASREASQAMSEHERRESIWRDAARSLTVINETLVAQLVEHAPAVRVDRDRSGGIRLALGGGTLTITKAVSVEPGALSAYGSAARMDVVGYAVIEVKAPRVSAYGYQGRSHSLWFCDAVVEGRYQWFELAFMRIFGQSSQSIDPYALRPGSQAGEAISNVMTTEQLGWPFTPLTAGDLDDFVERWAQWLAFASQGRLSHPSHMPERPTAGCHR